MTNGNEGFGSNIPESEDPNLALGPNNPTPDPNLGQQAVYLPPPQPQFGQPQPGYVPPQSGDVPPQQPSGFNPQFTADPQLQGTMNSANGVLLNYWLSVFFTIIPAIIFYFVVPKNSRYHQLHADNLNFSILHTIVQVGLALLNTFLPFSTMVMLGLAPLVFFVVHLIAAVKVSSGPDTMREDPFLFNIKFVQ